MPVDASIYGQIQQPQQANPLNSLAQAMQIQQLQRQGERADMATDQQNKLLKLVGSPEFQQMDTSGKSGALQGVGAFDKAGELVRSEAAAAKDRREAEKFQLEGYLKKYEVAGQIMNGVTDQATWERARQQTAQIFGPEAAAQMPPQYDPALIEQKRAQAMSVKDNLEQRYKALTAGETQRHNLATEATAAGTLKNSQDRLAFDQNQPKGQIVQTDNGTMLVDPRTGEARPVTADGQPVQKPGKDIPANINKSIIENQQNIAKIDQAMAAIKARPSSLGTQYMIPGAETVGQYLDPAGVEARAGVADVGSLILHDRSGAAVTASETPRLKPFIPSASDTPEVAQKKLARFRDLYQQEADLLSQTYSKDQGYKESPLLKTGVERAAAAPAGGVIAVTDAASYAKVPSGATYTTPDGKTRRKP